MTLKNVQKLERDQLKLIKGGTLCCPNGNGVDETCYIVEWWQSCKK